MGSMLGYEPLIVGYKEFIRPLVYHTRPNHRSTGFSRSLHDRRPAAESADLRDEPDQRGRRQPEPDQAPEDRLLVPRHPALRDFSAVLDSPANGLQQQEKPQLQRRVTGTKWILRA